MIRLNILRISGYFGESLQPSQNTNPGFKYPAVLNVFLYTIPFGCNVNTVSDVCNKTDSNVAYESTALWFYWKRPKRLFLLDVTMGSFGVAMLLRELQ